MEFLQPWHLSKNKLSKFLSKTIKTYQQSSNLKTLNLIPKTTLSQKYQYKAQPNQQKLNVQVSFIKWMELVKMFFLLKHCLFSFMNNLQIKSSDCILNRILLLDMQFLCQIKLVYRSKESKWNLNSPKRRSPRYSKLLCRLIKLVEQFLEN